MTSAPQAADPMLQKIVDALESIRAEEFDYEILQAASDVLGNEVVSTWRPSLSYLPPEYSNELRRITTLRPPERERAAAALARRIERASLFAVYASRAMPELVSRRLGCIVHQPVYPGLDLAALCLRDGTG